MDDVRIGVVGCGAIGGWHARILAEASACRLAGVCDTRPEAAQAVAAEHGTTAYTDLEALLAHEHLDGLIIATPDALHHAQALQAMAAGCHLLIEKPVARSTVELESIAAASRRHAVQVMGGHVERFETGAATMKDALDRQACGRVLSLAARRQFSGAEAPRFAGVSSTLRTLAVHDFDLVCWMHAAPVREVHTVGAKGPLYESTGLYDHLLTLLAFTDDAIGVVETGWTLPALGRHGQAGKIPSSGNNRLEVVGTQGMLCNDLGLRAQQLAGYDDHGVIVASLGYQTILGNRVVGALREETTAFVEMIRSGSPSPVGLGGIAKTLRLLDAAERSLATGVAVGLKEAPD